jgi:lysyl-tRNA synthetase, class II
VTGKLFTTHAGRADRKVESVTLLSKSIQPLPKEWYGLKDVETRLRQRYLDLILNDNVRETLVMPGAGSWPRSASFSMRGGSWKSKRR